MECKESESFGFCTLINDIAQIFLHFLQEKIEDFIEEKYTTERIKFLYLDSVAQCTFKVKEGSGWIRLEPELKLKAVTTA